MKMFARKRYFSLLLLASAVFGERPNLLIIHTDEHNFRTLGCYRDLMSEDQSFVWGDRVAVDTPNIDSLAHDGAICTSYYASSPVCTPSRASFNTGLYPVHTGSPINDMPMNDDMVTFAEMLRRNGYATSYIGKWHLDGDAKPGFAPARHFGWEDNRYMFNRGHWKLLRQAGDSAEVIGQFDEKKNQYKFDITQADEESFTTDFLVGRTLEILERDKNKPFCVMLSIPDPHGPNHVRAPYNSMFEDMTFENPRTMTVDEKTMPGWVNLQGKNMVTMLKQEQMQWYFGMVKCIDDNVGRILECLKKQELDKNTIVVFTSDHGDLMGEHKKHNKGNPYEASAKIPFLIRWPGHIPAGKVLRGAQSNVDFAPMVLSMMDIKSGLPEFHGEDTSGDFLSSDTEVSNDRTIYITNANGRWVAAVSSRYKLVLSTSDDPWLFDLQKDPDELTNFYNNPEYKPVAEKMQSELMAQMKRYSEPALEAGNLICGTGEKAPVPVSPVLEASEGYVVDTGGQSVKGSKPGQWSRALTVPAGTFEPNSTYEMELEWESKGLDSDASFFANFIAGKKDRANRQVELWPGDAGKFGVIKKTLTTTDSRDWVLHVGVRGRGELVIKRIRIKKK